MVQDKISFKKFLPGIAWLFIVSVLVFMPGNDLPKASWLDGLPIDKIVHATLFGGLVFFFCLPYFRSSHLYVQKINYFTKIFLGAVIWGITVEVIQKYFVPGRGFEWLDWAADSAGALIAFWISIKITKHFKRA